MSHSPSDFTPVIRDPEPHEEKELLNRLSEVRLGLMYWVPFFGHLVMKLKPIVARKHHNIPTAAVTRDRKLYLNYDFCKELSTAEFLFVLCHEVLHLANFVFERGEGRDVILATQDANGNTHPFPAWNAAHDYAINDIIVQMTEGNDDVVFPEVGGLHDEKYRDWSAEEIYDELVDKASNNDPIDMPGFGLGDIRPDLNGDGDQPEGGDQEGDGNPQSGGEDLSESQKKKLDDYWRVAVCEAAQVHEQSDQTSNGKPRGWLPNNLRKMIDEILNPKISWVDVLSRWVGENGKRANFSYRRPSRRSESVGEMLPSMIRHGVDDIVVLWDTSGSMEGREVEIMSEVIAICEDMSMSLRVICCDTQVASDQSDVQDPEDVNWAGGGGSNFKPAFALLHEEGYTGVVVTFTDGYIGVPDAKPPHIRDVLWVLWEAENDVDPTHGTWGEVVRVNEDGWVMNPKD